MADKIFFDTNPFIYYLENNPQFSGQVAEVLKNGVLSEAEFYTSTISDAEFLVKPYKDNDFETADRYYEFVENFGFVRCYISHTIAQLSARLRAKYKSLRLADSLQLAAAIDCGCSVFVTNDTRLKAVSELSVVIIGAN